MYWLHFLFIEYMFVLQAPNSSGAPVKLSAESREFSSFTFGISSSLWNGYTQILTFIISLDREATQINLEI